MNSFLIKLRELIEEKVIPFRIIQSKNSIEFHYLPEGFDLDKETQFLKLQYSQVPYPGAQQVNIDLLLYDEGLIGAGKTLQLLDEYSFSSNTPHDKVCRLVAASVIDAVNYFPCSAPDSNFSLDYAFSFLLHTNSPQIFLKVVERFAKKATHTKKGKYDIIDFRWSLLAKIAMLKGFDEVSDKIARIQNNFNAAMEVR